MRRYTLLFALALVAGITQFSLPSTVKADTALSSLTLTLAVEAQADGTAQPTVRQSSWGALKAIYRGDRDDTSNNATQDSTSATGLVKPGADMNVLSGGVTVAWPFGTPKTDWRGWTGDKTSGGSIPNYCGDRNTTINSHSLGDYYARDLYRNDGQQAHQPIYASTGGYVLLAGKNGCYGYTVIIWDPTRGLEFRYSHLSSVNPYVGPNMSIRQGALIGWVGGTGCGGVESFTAHLHMVVYKNLPYLKIGQICSGSAYACPFYFN